MGHKKQVRCHDWKRGCGGYIEFEHGHSVKKRKNNEKYAYACNRCGLLHWGNGRVAINADGNRTKIGVTVAIERPPTEVNKRRAERRKKKLGRVFWFGGADDGVSYSV